MCLQYTRKLVYACGAFHSAKILTEHCGRIDEKDHKMIDGGEKTDSVAGNATCGRCLGCLRQQCQYTFSMRLSSFNAGIGMSAKYFFLFF